MTDTVEPIDLTPNPEFLKGLQQLPFVEPPIDMTPDPNYIGGMQSDHMTLWDGISELVDNALDAGATRIVIKINNSRIEVRDNGRGCDSIKRILRLGEHGERGKKDSGWYGQGAASAAMALGRVIEIETIHSGIKRTIKVDWNMQREMKTWIGPSPTGEATRQPSGTAMILSGLKKSTKTNSITAVKNHIQRIFTPGIKSGCQILINDEEIKPLLFHPLHDAVELEGTFEGKNYKLRFGSFKKTDSSQSGFWVRFGHRFIMARDWDAGKDCICHRFHADIELIDGKERWDRERQKRTFHEREAFFEAIFPQVEPLLRQLQEEMNKVELSDLCESMERAFELALPGKVKATRRRRPGTPDPPSPGAKPTGTGTKPTKFKETQPGGDVDQVGNPPPTSNGHQRGIIIRFNFEHKGEEYRMLDVTLGKSCLVTFNQDTNFVRAFINNPAQLTFTALQAFLTEAAYKDDFLQLSMFETPMEKYLYAVTLAFNQVMPAFVK